MTHHTPTRLHSGTFGLSILNIHALLRGNDIPCPTCMPPVRSIEANLDAMRLSVFRRAQLFHFLHATNDGNVELLPPAAPSAPGEGADHKRISLPLSPTTESVVRSAQQLEDIFESLLSFDDGSNDEDDNMLPDPIQFVPNEDGHLLKCRRPKIYRDGCPSATILGIEENASLYREHIPSEGVGVEMTTYRPTMADDNIKEGCCCDHPMGDWIRNRKESKRGANELSNGSNNGIANLRVVDFTQFQLQRRSESASKTSKPIIFSSPGNVCHLVRSVLKCPGTSSHCASPWSSRYATDTACTSSCPCQHRDQVVALVLLGHPNDTKNGDGEWEKIERKELSDLVKFRVGDASPSYHLHSVSKLSIPKNADALSLFGASSATTLGTGSSDTMPVTLLVYRHLTPRKNLSIAHPVSGATVENSQDPYYLWETFQPPKVNDDTNDDPLLAKVQDDEPPPPQYRLVAPPYQSHRDLYPGLLDEIMKPENIAAITDEALRIPQWTAWPEKNHYSSPDDDEEGDGESEGREDSPYPATWTVFPLCHTFPANIVESRKWISKTCNFVPRTAALLEGLGPALRTALFSRLEPRTTLSAHTGWADLANHVLRLHIPLVVPGGSQNLGLCGTWVDGSVETHRMGEIVCFDDSKVHRAFNYTEEERIVLILDLARTDALPLGTATGGHTEELDKFIQELT